jgi:hypothetical protein
MKKTLFTLLLVMTLLVSACGGSTGPTGTGYIGGNSGLDIAFYEGAPPATTPDGGQQEFDIILDVTNKGEDAVEIEEAYIEISGFPPEALGVTMAQLRKNLPERMEARIKSGDGTIIDAPVVPVSFEGFNYMDTEISGRDVTVRAEICYEYQTYAAAELCIKENFNINKENDLCQVTGVRTLSSSGAPVQVTNLRQSTAGTDKTRFTFSISNVDTGSIYRTDSECVDGFTNQNKVFVKISGLGTNSGDVKCVGLSGGTTDAGYVSLVPGMAKEISCTFTVTDRNNRIEPFNIELSYAYWKFVDKIIQVQYTPK